MVLEITDIMKILPHRPPMLLVDRIVEIDPFKSATGIKNVTMNEPFFVGHFQDYHVRRYGKHQVQASGSAR